MSKIEEKTVVKKGNSWVKITMLIALIVLGILLFSFTEVGNYLRDVDFMRTQVAKAGIWGFMIYIILFVGLSLLVLPMTFLMAIAVLVFGTWEGILLTYIATFFSAMSTFILGRWMGGGSLSNIKNKWAQKAIAGAENNPIRTIVVLRTLMQLSPLIGYSLSLTRISTNRYIIGNIIGIAIPILYLGLAFILMESTVLEWMGVQP